MDKTETRLTVYFEEPFWVGVVERITDERLSVAKMTFGAEPKEYEVYAFLLKYYYDMKFSPAIEADVKDAKTNPKRVQRDVRKQMQQTGIGTKSQQALKLQQQQSKIERKCKSRKLREAEAERKFELKQQKKRDKHRGR